MQRMIAAANIGFLSFFGKWQRLMPVFLTILIVIAIIAEIEQSMMFSAFKSIIADTGDPIGAGWLISVYYVVAGPAAVIAGRLGDMYGRKTVLLWVLLIVVAGSTLSSIVHDMLFIIVGRGLQGVSGAIIPLCVALYRENAPPAKLGLGLGILLSASAIGTFLGVLIGGAIVDHYHWRSMFVVAAVFALCALLAALLFVPPSSQRLPDRLDWLGLGIAPILICLLYGISSLNSPHASTMQAVGIIVCGLLFLGLWIIHELRFDKPMLNLRSFRNREIRLANLTALITALGPNQVTLYFSLLLQQPRWTGLGFGMSATTAGMWKAPTLVLSATAAPIAGQMITRVGPRRVLIAGALTQAVGWLTALTLHHDFWTVFMSMSLCVVGAMITHVGVTGTVALAVAKENTGEALGTATVTRSVGSAIGSQLMALLLSLSVVRGAEHPGQSFPDGSAHMFTLLMVLLMVIGALVIALGYRPSAIPIRKPEGLIDLSH